MTLGKIPVVSIHQPRTWFGMKKRGADIDISIQTLDDGVVVFTVPPTSLELDGENVILEVVSHGARSAVVVAPPHTLSDGTIVNRRLFAVPIGNVEFV